MQCPKSWFPRWVEIRFSKMFTSNTLNNWVWMGRILKCNLQWIGIYPRGLSCRYYLSTKVGNHSICNLFAWLWCYTLYKASLIRLYVDRPYWEAFNVDGRRCEALASCEVPNVPYSQRSPIPPHPTYFQIREGSQKSFWDNSRKLTPPTHPTDLELSGKFTIFSLQNITQKLYAHNGQISHIHIEFVFLQNPFLQSSFSFEAFLRCENWWLEQRIVRTTGFAFMTGSTSTRHLLVISAGPVAFPGSLQCSHHSSWQRRVKIIALKR